ncbi:MAG: D-Ala-D-Ala carboxypeptidase family metallohydrolase [Actinomycetota bacterium]
MLIERTTGTIRTHSRSTEHATRLSSVCEREHLTLAQTAYVLATAQHETRMGLWMIEGESGWAYEGRHYLGNTEPGDGPRYRGRGFVPLIGRRQYSYWQRRLRLPLVDRPDLAAEPDVAAEILVRGMVEGTFTGHRLADYVNETDHDYVGARQVIRDRDRAVVVARLAKEFEVVLQPPTAGDDDGALRQHDVRTAQRHLRAIGWPLVVDGFLGTFTRRALADFQRGHTFDALSVTGTLDVHTSRALARCAEGGGYASPHFRFVEFRTAGPQRLCLGNRVISVARPLVHALERLRAEAGEPVHIASGYRSEEYNATIGGAPDSAHLQGNAVDLWSPRLTVDRVVALGVFTGVGVGRDGAVHLEVAADGSTQDPHVYRLRPRGTR